MGTLFSGLNSSLDALRAFQNALNVSQNNVSNASTPGYSAQKAILEALPFDPSSGMGGGVVAGPTQSTDSQYADAAVRNQLEAQAGYTAQSNALASIQPLFDVSGQSGVLGALNTLFNSFSAWSANPSSSTTQQAVLSSAQALGSAFQSAASSLSQLTGSLNQQINSTVSQINTLSQQIAADNKQIGGSLTPDPDVEANLQSSLDSLSKLTDITVRFETDGTATVLAGGQTPLVIGQQQYDLSTSFNDSGTNPIPGGTNDAHILNADGQDITSQISQGTLGGLLNVRNTVLPGLQGNGQQQGALNQLAQQVADRVNAILTSAQTTTGGAGAPLFSYNSSSPADIASTLTLDPNITPGGLAPVDPGPPQVGNGAALDLSNLGTSTDPADMINGQSILTFSAGLAETAGQQASNAQNGQSLATQQLAQAQALQTQISGVSLDGEAIQVMELQKGYDAAGKMVGVIDQLASALLNMIPAA